MSEEESISLYDLLNLSIGAPHRGAVDFSALHALLHAVLTQLDIRETKTRWRDSPPVDRHPGALPGVPAPWRGHHAEGAGPRAQTDPPVHPGSEQRHRAASPSSPAPPDQQTRLRFRIQTCEDDVSKAMKLIEELHSHKDSVKEEMKELRLQQKVADAQVETLAVVEQCCHRVDALEETVRSLTDSLKKYPDPEELSGCVTWDVLQGALLGDRGSTQVCVGSGVCDPTVGINLTPFHSNSSAVPSHSGSPSAPSSPSTSDTQAAVEAPSGLLTESTGSSERHAEAVEALRDVGKLRETFGELEARVSAVEEGKAEQSQLRELLDHKESQDASGGLTDQLKQQRTLIDSLTGEQQKNVELVNDVQRAILQLQAESEKLHESSRCLHEDNRRHIEELYKTTEELQEKKADKQMVESEIKADKSALESKVSRLQFDSVTEQLSAMFHELLNKVTGQEQDWHKVIDRLSAEMECKLNRIELDSVKKQLEGRWKNIHEKLQAQGAPEHEDAAALRKQLVDRFHCLSCDRPVVKYSSGPHLVKLPSTPGFPAHKSMRPFTVFALEQFRQHYRSLNQAAAANQGKDRRIIERISELTDYSHLTVSRSCGGSHTVTSASQRRTGLQPMKLHGQTELDGVIQSEEVGIIGLDGHIYKGRLNAPAVRNTETKLPTISTKEGLCKTKDKARCSLSNKPAASPEAPLQPPHSAKSVQCSRSASSSSGRDWPVSALGCTSHSSFAQASAAAESHREPQADEPVNL